MNRTDEAIRGFPPCVGVAAMIGAVLLAACENPQPPGLCGTIAEQTVVVGETATVSACFDDANGDMLSFGVSTSDPGIATVRASGSTVTVTAVAPGAAFMTVTATDATGLSGSQRFRVLVPNRAPVVLGAIDGRELPAGESVDVDVSSHFAEPDGQELSFAFSVPDESVVSISADGPVVTIAALAKGSATVTVTATDPGGLSASQSFRATVPNRAPAAQGSMPEQTIEVGASTAMDVTEYFSDPDGDALAYTAISSDAEVVVVSISGADLTVGPIAKGVATVTVTATDEEGLTATQEFAVTAPNRPPVATGSMEARTIEVDETADLDLSSHFSDPDGDALVFTATVSDAAVIGASVDGGILTVGAAAKGEAAVTVTATDTEGLTATQGFVVTVPNRGPVATDSFAEQTIEVGETADLDLSGHFSDPDGDALTYTATPSDAALIDVSVEDGTVTVVALAKGEATVTITAADPEGLTAAQAFLVTVPNRPPLAVGTIEALALDLGDNATLQLPRYFQDPDGDDLAYSVSSSDATLIGVSAEGAAATVEALAKGDAVVTVTATDAGGLAATQAFAVSVANRSPQAVGSIEAQTVQVGESVAMELPGYFEDPDGDGLAYTASAPEGSVIDVSVAGTGVEITALRKGGAPVTVTAADSEGMTATQEFVVTVPNRPPEAVGSVPDMRIREGSVGRADPSPLFTDPDGDALAFDASSSDPQVARAWSASNGVVVRAVKEGTATVSISAEDPEGMTATQQFSVRVDGSSGGSNQPPFVTGSVGEQTLRKGRSRTIDLSSRFSDPDGDNLRLSAESSNGEVVTATASGGDVELRAVTNGTATVKIIAKDPGGLTATLTFAVRVSETGGPNRPPVVSATILEQDMGEGDTRMLSASSYFTDPDEDDLTFSAESSDADVVKTSTSGDAVELEVVSQGTATITVTAKDAGGLSTAQAFGVTAGEAANGNRAPTAVGAVSAQNLEENGSTRLDASAYFTDPDNDALAYSAESSNDAVVTATASGTEITLRAAGTGTATVTLTAEDPSGLEAELDFDVTVVEETPNRAPVAGTIDAQRMSKDDSRTLDASAYFSDPDDDELTFAAESSDTTVVRAIAGDDNELRLSGVGPGTATVSVTAEDPEGLSAEAEFQVTVTRANRPPRVKQEPWDETYLVGAKGTERAWWYFEDPDDDYEDLRFEAVSSDPEVLAVRKTNRDTFELTAKKLGKVTFTITATDPDGLSASVSMEHTVGNNAPRINLELNDIVRSPGEEYPFFLQVRIFFHEYSLFVDRDFGDSLSFSIESSNPAVATAEYDDNQISVIGTVTAVALGEATITATATDRGGLSTDYSFKITVNSNRPPTVTEEIPDYVNVTAPDSIVVPLSEHFEDPEGDSLTYEIKINDWEGDAVAYLTGDTLVITRGRGVMNVYALDPEGRSVRDGFEFKVR